MKNKYQGIQIQHLHSQKEQESVTQQAREARHFLQAVAVCKDSFTQENTARMSRIMF